MYYWTTEIKAIDPSDGVLKKWAGPNVPGINESDAKHYLETHELGYCEISGQLIAEIPCEEETGEADFSSMISYENLN